jgi:hypothetical protein
MKTSTARTVEYDDLEETIKGLFGNGVVEVITPGEIEKYSFLQVVPTKDKRGPARGIFAYDEDSGMVYKVSGNIRHCIALTDVSDKVQDAICFLSQKLDDNPEGYDDDNYVCVRFYPSPMGRPPISVTPPGPKARIDF